VSIPTEIDFDDFLKAVDVLAKSKDLVCKMSRGTGSAIRFDLFRNGERVPFQMWVVHEDKKERKIYSQDLKKACRALGTTKKDFKELISKKFKI